MQNYKIMPRWALAAAAAFAILPITGMASAEDYPKLTLTHATGLNENYPLAEATTRFNEQVAKESGGNIEIKMFWGGALGGLKEALDIVSKGAVDIADIVPGYFNTQLPLQSMTNALPHTFFDPNQAMYALVDMSENNPLQIKEFKDANVKPLIFRALGTYYFLCTKPVKTMEDFKGLKVRSFGAYMPKMMEALGATPVNVVISDAYEAMKRGSLDCTYSPGSDHAAFKLYEVAKNLINLPMGGIAAYTDSMNLAKFNSLDKNTQDLLVRAGKDATDWWASQVDANEKAAIDTMLADGVQWVEFEETDKFRAVMPDMLSLWQQSMTERGLEDVGKQYSEALMGYYNAHKSK
ncbi:C4-dicarboxylate TRAP transporter substrate-binding protein [Hoeflea sp.]|uniref:C4-dicarboxylate TRAP transporter substrate-binding protein n=1 Tax=Hoeflea sp. TaxID=1940281 RepID=UPI003A914B52